MKKILRGMILIATAAVVFIAQAEVAISVSIAPPALPIYVQPPMPGDGYLWTPGYWGWNDADHDYFWVPGTWVAAPYVGALWTPGYWGWGGGGYAWHGGYWGSHIGFYGGVNYGFGYGGSGYQGGYWNNGAFRYNRSANNFGSTRVANVYNARMENATSNRVSYNGGRGGTRMQPTRGEQSIAAMPHNAQTSPQMQHELASRTNQDLRASINHGNPRIAATPEPGAFNSPAVVAARSPQNGRAERPRGAAVTQQPFREKARGQPGAQMPQRAQPEMRQEMRQAPQASPQHQNAPRQQNPHEQERHEK